MTDNTNDTRRFRFGVEVAEPFAGSTWADTFKEIEQLGYTTVFVPDHFNEGLGPITAMTLAASVTTTLNVGTLVLACDFRHPAVLARELAGLDLVSQGRLEVGVGAGYKNIDYDTSGIVKDRAGVRVDRMIEHVEVLRGLFADGPFSFDGEHYQIADLDGTPYPHTPGGPPILVGGGGPRVLKWAARNADIVGITPSIHSGVVDEAAAQDGQESRIDEKIGWVRDAAGDRYESLELNIWVAVASLTDDAAGFAEVVAPGFGVSADEVLRSPITLIGDGSSVVDMLQERRDRWDLSYHVLPAVTARDFGPIVAELAGT